MSLLLLLLSNYIVEENLMNSGVGTIKEIIYANSDGPRGPNGPRQIPPMSLLTFPTARFQKRRS
jgi:hypothetical protein